MRNKLLLLSLISGLLSGLPWHDHFPGLIILTAFVPILFIEDYFFKRKAKSSFYDLFKYSFLTFLIWNIVATYWLIYSGFFSALIVILTNTIAMSITFGLFHLIKKQFDKKIGYLSLILFWISFEYIFLNTHLTWPWLNIGNSLAKELKLIQWYEYTGVLGGTFWILTLNILLFKLAKDFKNSGKIIYKKTSIFLLVLFIPVSISLYLYKTHKETGEKLNIIVVQPNLDAYTEKYKMPQSEQTNIILDLIKKEINENTDYVICPETAINNPIWEHDLEEDSSIRSIKELQNHFPKTTFIIGASTKKKYSQFEKIIPALKYDSIRSLYYQNYNAALQIDTSKTIPIYYKSQLVSGVETMPFLWLFGFLDNLTFDFGGTTRSLGFQKQREVFNNANNIKIAPVICYESAFGEFVSNFIKKEGSLITLITNDGWWGDSPGYKQHLRLSQLRAIENRRSIARSANTGISCFINQQGEIISHIEYNKRNSIKNTLTTNSKLTFYSTYGDYIGRVTLFISLIILLYYIINLKLTK